MDRCLTPGHCDRSLERRQAAPAFSCLLPLACQPTGGRGGLDFGSLLPQIRSAHQAAWGAGLGLETHLQAPVLGAAAVPRSVCGAGVARNCPSCLTAAGISPVGLTKTPSSSVN